MTLQNIPYILGVKKLLPFFDSTLSLARQEDQTTDEQVQNEEYSNQLPHQRRLLQRRILKYDIIIWSMLKHLSV